MAVDRGGLNYRIQIKDSFSRTTEKFRDELAKSQAAFADFQAGVASHGASVAALQETAEAAKGLTTANRAAAKAITQRATASKKAKEIDDLVIEAAERAETARKVQTRAEQLGFDLRRKVIKQLTVEQEAQKKAAKALRQIEVQKRRNQILEKAGIQVGKQKVKQLTVEEEALKRVERRLRSLAVSERVRNEISARTQGPKLDDVESAALARVAAAIRKKAVAERAGVIASERGVELGKKKVQQLSFEELALAKVEAAERRRALAARVQQIEDQRKIGPRLADGSFISKGTNKEVTRLRDLLKSTNSEGNSLFFTFRRLFGILAAFQAARLAVSGFLATIREGLNFNSQIEQARISIGGLIRSTGDLRDEFGNVLTPAQQLVEAEKLANKQVNLLRQSALNTTATFEELLETFQVAITPGLAGGLTLDEVRKLAVNVSQAAGALGIAQNQLSEEIRSIIQGTGQLRTTRLLALVSNEEIRRAREAGNLFALLNERLGGFNEAAERAARSTLPGVLARIKDFFQAALGGASKGLFEDLLNIGNALFERVLTVRNELGELQPNPQIVSILREVFDALRDILGAVLQAGQELGLKGAREGVRAFAQALRIAGQIAVGVAKGLVTGFKIVNGLFRGLAAPLHLTNTEFAAMAGHVAAVITPILLLRSLLRSVGVNLVFINALLGQKLVARLVVAGKAIKGAFLAPLAVAAAAVAAVGLGFNQVAEAIFGVNLSIKDTVDLLGLGLAGAFQSVIEFVQIAFVRVSGFFRDAFSAAVNFAADIILESKRAVAALAGNDEDLAKLSAGRAEEELKREQAAAKGRKADEEEIARIRELGTFTQLELEKKIAKVIGEAAGKDAQGDGFNVPTFDFDQFLSKVEDFKGSLDDSSGSTFLSTVRQQVQQLQDELSELESEARKARAEFAQVFNQPEIEGVAGQIEDIFRTSVVDAAEKARSVTLAILNTQRQIAELSGQSFAAGSEDEAQRVGKINVLRKEEQILIEARVGLEQQAADIARTRAAILAAQEIPKLALENSLLAQRLRAERAIAAAARNRATDQQLNVLSARADLNASLFEAAQSQASLRQQILTIQERSIGMAGDELTSANAYLAALQQRLALEQGVAGAQQEQLRLALEQAILVQSGTVTQGLREGLVQLASELPTFFEAGVNIAKSAVQSFSSFLSSALVAAFDPSQNTSFEEQLGRFLQGLAQTILDNLIQAALGQLISNSLGLSVGASTLQLAATTLGTVVPGLQFAASTMLNASIALGASGSFTGIGLAKGGPVPHMKAKGYDRGGRIKNKAAKAHRPRGLDPRDVIPIWAARGEFMQQASAVRKYGLSAMHAINQGLVDPMGLQALATNTAPAMSHAPALPGYAEGGMISDHVSSSAALGAAGSGSGGGGRILPVMVAREGEFDRLLAGGKSAFLRFMRENSSDVNSSLDRGRSKR